MNVLHNASLKPFNSFAIDVKVSRLVHVQSVKELKLLLKRNYAEELFILGGGSNLLLTKDVDATVLHIDIKGKEIITETESHVFVKAYAGENWHEFVLFTLQQGWGGLENLSLIPGNVGTAPIQNIGAYGVELKDHFESCEVIDIQTLEDFTLNAGACEFDYRNSIFKNKAKGKYIITSVLFKLTKKGHRLLTSYGSVEKSLQELGIKNPTPTDISNAVIALRKEKLPDPKLLGNSGSFFKNPVILEEDYKKLQKEYPEIPHYNIGESKIKIPAGWLIEKAGFKGFREGDAGVHKNQALVLVNYGSASGTDILNLAKKIQQAILEKFRIHLEPEVNII